MNTGITNIPVNEKPKFGWFFSVDLIIYLAVMFLVREIYFPDYNFITNGLFWSFTTLILATLIMRFRGITWRDLGLIRPENYKQLVYGTAFILVFSIGSIMVFQIFKDQLGLEIAPDKSHQQATSKFGDLAGNWLLFLMIIPFIWLESMLEELLDRGFLMNWIERIFSCTWFATAIALIAQAMIFGFRHSNDFSSRSITVGLIGFGMGVGYLVFKRNLWPLIIAHCILNTMSMIDRV